MDGALRSIAVTVEEPRPGAFEWVLLELSAEWGPIQRAKHATDSYAQAMAAGLWVLQQMIVDLDAGPRERARERPPAKRAAFGFGFGGLK